MKFGSSVLYSQEIVTGLCFEPHES